MSGRTSFVISVVTEPKRSIRDAIYARVRMGKCIVHREGASPKSPEDSCFACDKDAHSLGVCSTHYSQYVRTTANLDPVEEERITDALVTEGQILRSQQVREIMCDSPIQRIARAASEK